METTTRRSVPALIRELLDRPREFSFVQAVRLLGSIGEREESGLTHANPENGLRFRPKLSLDFPPTDLDTVEFIDGKSDGYLVTTTFLGLYGTSSPLPAFYTEEFFDDESEDIHSARDFLDIIHTAFYRLFFKTSTRYHLPYKVVEEMDRAVIDRLYSLLGFGSPELRKSLPESYYPLRHLGIFSQYPRSAAALRCLVSDIIGEKDVEIEQCRPSRATIPPDQRCRLGKSANQLGRDSYTGSTIATRSGAFRIEIGPIEPATFQRLLPGTTAAAVLSQEVNLFIDQPFTWDMALHVRKDTSMKCRLGETTWNRLGVDAWMDGPGSASGTSTVLFRPN